MKYTSINSRQLSTYLTIDTELNISKEKNYLFDLSYLSVLEVKGEQAQSFLQGQLTCDLNQLSDIQMLQGAQCNLKGRILCLMDIVNWNGIQLVLPSDLSLPTQLSLSKAALLSKISIKEQKQLKIFGFLFQNPNDLLPATSFFSKNLYALAYGSDFCYYHLGNGFYIFLFHSEAQSDFLNQFQEQKQLLGSLTWHTLRLQYKHFDIYPESRGLFLPHRLDLHQTQLISFNKGCYKGQEIIARTHYKATLKHELNIYHIKTKAHLYSGQKLFRVDTHSEFGEIVDYSIIGNQESIAAISHLKEPFSTLKLENDDNPIDISTFY